MNRWLFLGFLFIYYALFLVVSRLILILVYFKIAPNFLKKRRAWEARYWKSSGEDNFSPDYVFEFSSEGELEQIRYFLERSLQKGLRCDLYFCSPSVERAVTQMASQYPKLVRARCVPLLYVPLPWSPQWDPQKRTAIKRYFQVKYDFFPHLLWKAYRSLQSTLIGAHWRSKAWPNYFFYFPFKEFTTCLVETYQKLLTYAGESRVDLCDFRILRIQERQDVYAQTLRQRYPTLEWLWDLLEKKSGQVVLHGNAWPKEILPFLQSWHQRRQATVPYLMVPHEVNDESLALYKKWREDGLVEVIDEKTVNGPHLQWNRPVILFVKGILCELYKMARYTVVGGGYNHKVHSLLEPYLANAQVFCGPHTQYSQEFSLIESQDTGSIVRSFSVEQSQNEIEKHWQASGDQNFSSRNWVNEIKLKTLSLQDRW